MAMQPKPGSDWSHIAWGHPDAVRSALCSYYSAGIAADVVPLFLCAGDGRVAQFCRQCQRGWWGLRDG